MWHPVGLALTFAAQYTQVEAPTHTLSSLKHLLEAANMKWPQDSCRDREKVFYTVKNWPQCKTRSNQCTSLSLLPLSSLAIACLSSPTSWTHTSLPQPDQERLCPPDSMTSRHEQIMHHTNLVSSPPFQYMDNSNGPNPVWYDD